jgi:hypothetical protein
VSAGQRAGGAAERGGGRASPDLRRVGSAKEHGPRGGRAVGGWRPAVPS